MSVVGDQAAAWEAKAKQLREQAKDVAKARGALEGLVAEPKKTIRSAAFTGPFASRMSDRASDITSRLRVAVEQMRSAEARLRSKAAEADENAASYRFQESLEFGNHLRN